VRVATYTQGSLTALPLVLAEQLGYFKQEGLAVDVEEMASGAKASQALVGGSADVASAFYELTLQMAAQGRNLISFVNLARYPGYVLMGSPASASKVHRVEDLKNSMVAISSPGSPTDQFLKYVLIHHGLPADAASTVAAGSNAARVAILEHGGVAAAVLSDPAASQFLKRHPNTTMLADVRNSAGVRQLFSTDTYVSAVLTSSAQWLQRNPDSAHRIARAMNRSLDWMQHHTLEEIAKQTPEKLKGSDAAVFAEALRASFSSFPPDGRFESGGINAVRKVLTATDPQAKLASLDLAKTYTNEFVTADK